MSDTPQGPDWWQASDDKWYPPPRPAMPGQPDVASAAPAMAPPGGPPPGGPPMAPPAGPPSGPQGPGPGPGFGPPGVPSGGYPASGPPSGGFPPGGPPSPYGMPPGAARPGSQNRTALFVAIGVVVATALVGLVVILTSGGDDTTDDPQTSPTTAQPDPGGTTDTTGGTSDTTTGGEPSGSATVEVVDSGFSNFMGGFDHNERSVAYGFILENTSDDVATDISISVSAYDAGDNAVASDSLTVYLLRPGEKIGLGDEFYGTAFAADVARVDVQVSEPQDGFGSDDVPAEGTITAEGITTQSDEFSITTTFTAKSTYAEQVDYPYPYAIYRNAAGDIIGGSTGTIDFIPANGSTAGEVRSWDAIPNIETTEIYIDPGFFD